MPTNGRYRKLDLSEEVIADLICRYTELGHSCTRIAKDTGRDWRIVYAALNQNGVHMRTQRQAAQRPDREEVIRDLVHRFNDLHQSIAEISAETRTRIPTVRYWLKRGGVKLPPQWLATAPPPAPLPRPREPLTLTVRTDEILAQTRAGDVVGRAEKHAMGWTVYLRRPPTEVQALDSEHAIRVLREAAPPRENPSR